MNVFLTPDEAKRNLAVNLWWALSHQKNRSGYAWLAAELGKRYGRDIHVSRIQKILEQTSSPDWSFVVNLADVLHIEVEELGREPSANALRAYLKKYPAKEDELAHAS